MTKDQNESSTTTVDPEIVKEAQRFLRENKDLKVQSYDYMSPRISSEIPDCSMPMTFDHYNYCHPAGTLVSTPNGIKPIEEFSAGESVLALETENNCLGNAQVIATDSRDVKELLELEMEDGTILELTPEHPVYVDGQGWVKAEDLNGDETLLKLI